MGCRLTLDSYGLNETMPPCGMCCNPSLNWSPRQPSGVPPRRPRSPPSLGQQSAGLSLRSCGGLPWGGSTTFSCLDSFPCPAGGQGASSCVVLGCPPSSSPSWRAQPWGTSPALCFPKHSPSPPSCCVDSESTVSTGAFPQENGVVQLQKQTEAWWCLF